MTDVNVFSPNAGVRLEVRVVFLGLDCFIQ